MSNILIESKGIPLWSENAAYSFLRGCKGVSITAQLTQRRITKVRPTQGYESSGLHIGEDGSFMVLLSARASFDNQVCELGCAIGKTFLHNITYYPPHNLTPDEAIAEPFGTDFAEKWLECNSSEKVIRYIRDIGISTE
jgi:hypothetical protein